MLVQSIGHTQGINNKAQSKSNQTSFKSIRIFKDIYPVKTVKMGISIYADGLKDTVQLLDVNRHIETVIGHSKNAEELEDMLNNLGEKITSSETLAKVRSLLNKCINDVLPELKKQYVSSDGKTYKLSKASLSNVKKSITKDAPEYLEKGSLYPGSNKLLCFKDF